MLSATGASAALAASACSALTCSFPLLPPLQYNPSTIDINTDADEMSYWIGILQARG